MAGPARGGDVLVLAAVMVAAQMCGLVSATSAPMPFSESLLGEGQTEGKTGAGHANILQQVKVEAEKTKGEELQKQLARVSSELARVSSELAAEKAKVAELTRNGDPPLGETNNNPEETADQLIDDAIAHEPELEIPQNAAKCNTNNDDQTVVNGTFDCGPKGDKCPDNMSMGCFAACNGELNGGVFPTHRPDGHALGGIVDGMQSLTFVSDQALAGQPIISYPPLGHKCNGVITKAVVAHPNMAGLDVGVLALKRVKCHKSGVKRFGGNSTLTQTCTSSKVAICIRSNRNHFTSVSSPATNAELRHFAKYVTQNAWVNAGTSTARLKSKWNCVRHFDKTAASDFIKVF